MCSKTAGNDIYVKRVQLREPREDKAEEEFIKTWKEYQKYLKFN